MTLLIAGLKVADFPHPTVEFNPRLDGSVFSVIKTDSIIELESLIHLPSAGLLLEHGIQGDPKIADILLQDESDLQLLRVLIALPRDVILDVYRRIDEEASFLGKPVAKENSSGSSILEASSWGIFEIKISGNSETICDPVFKLDRVSPQTFPRNGFPKIDHTQVAVGDVSVPQNNLGFTLGSRLISIDFKELRIGR